MTAIGNPSYYDMFSEKLKHCKSKKDYKRLCKEMIWQFNAIDGVDANLEKILSSVLGEEDYIKIMACAIKMYILEQQGIPYDLLATIDKSIDNY